MAATRRKKLLEAGVRSPEFRLDRLEGGEVTLQELLRDGRFVLAFFKITCPVCQFEFPYLERMHAGGGPLRIYGVSQNDLEDTREFNQEFGVTFPTLLDNEDDFEASDAFGISTVPTLFVIEADGRIGGVIEGWSKKDILWLGEQAGVNPLRPGEYVPEWKAG